jgi:hypothetical protein
MFARLTFIGALAFAPMASAAETPGADIPVQRSPAWTQAQTLIDGTGAPSLFENQSTATRMIIRHKASGLVCDYSPDEKNNSLMLFPGLPQGDDVGCNADAGNIYMTYYATRYGPGVSIQDAAAETAAGIRNRFPDARPYEGAVVQVTAPEGVGEQVYLAYVVGQGDRSLHAQARLAKVGEWIFKQRMSTPENMALGAETMLSVGRWTDVLEAAAD